MAVIDLGCLERFCKGDRDRVENYIRLCIDASPGFSRAWR